MPARCLSPRPLGSSGLEVSALSLGSWRTFEHVPRETGSAILAAARDEGINFFDDARYNDETGTAPMATGYSEVLFGELFRAAGVRRDEVVVANKLWWEFWPEQDAAAELDASLGRMGFDYVDLIYANPPPAGLAVGDLVAAVAGLVSSGKARAWAVVNWAAEDCGRAVEAAAGLGVPAPCAAQLPYSLVRRSWVEDPVMSRALTAAGAGVVASFCLEGGVLSGKYLAGAGAGAEGAAAAGGMGGGAAAGGTAAGGAAAGGAVAGGAAAGGAAAAGGGAERESSAGDGSAAGRAAGTLGDPRAAPAVAAAAELTALAAALGTTAAALALTFPLTNPAVASVLFGATSPGQLRANCAAAGLRDRLSDADIARLRQIGVPGS
jgi:aryl-alcohol dehydrogenase-like predicted oxidoreductase